MTLIGESELLGHTIHDLEVMAEFCDKYGQDVTAKELRKAIRLLRRTAFGAVIEGGNVDDEFSAHGERADGNEDDE